MITASEHRQATEVCWLSMHEPVRKMAGIVEAGEDSARETNHAFSNAITDPSHVCSPDRQLLDTLSFRRAALRVLK